MHHDSHFRQTDSGPASGPVLTVRAQSGLSGDMLLAGLAALTDQNEETLAALVDELRLPALRGCLRLETRSVRHIAGVGCAIHLPDEHRHRSLADIEALIENSALPQEAAKAALSAFGLLAEAEAAVHGLALRKVTFHEVGALDSILDICLCCRLFTMLAPERFVCSPLPLADGVIHCAHGALPSPAPAVLRLLAGVPVCGFAGQGETVTPTAICLLKALGAYFGPWPEMLVERTVISYGTKVFDKAPNGALWALGRAGRG